jgi:hypothetical protein
VQGTETRVQGTEARVQGTETRVQGTETRVLGTEPKGRTNYDWTWLNMAKCGRHTKTDNVLHYQNQMHRHPKAEAASRNEKYDITITMQGIETRGEVRCTRPVAL